jgi:uncharacterized protein
MHFNEADTSGGLVVRAYAAGLIRIADTDYRSSLILSPERVIQGWAPPAAERMQPSDLQPVWALEPELVVLGTGRVQRFPPVEVWTTVTRRGVGLEIMDTGAACRTYNILMSEGRRVVAALIML